MLSWFAIDQQAQTQGVSRRLVLGEIVQIAFLDALYKEKSSNTIFFQGGTSIRLLHHGWRYSEDLDFVIPGESTDFLDIAVHSAYQHCLRTLQQLFGPNTAGLELKHGKDRSKLKTFWLHFFQSGQEATRVKLEFACFPVHQPQSYAVKQVEGVWPITPLVMSESLPELLADKVTAFAGRTYIKGRDLFDLWYLTEVLDVKPDPELLLQKLADYHIAEPLDKLETRLGQVAEKHIQDEMQRFLPEPYQTRLAAERYQKVLLAVRCVIEHVVTALRQ